MNDHAVRIITVQSNHANFIELCRLLDTHLDAAAGGTNNRVQYIPHNALPEDLLVLIAYSSGMPVGCAALKLYSERIGEIKRVFVKPEFRRKGIACRLLQRLENAALTMGMNSLILETGEPLAASIALYTALGYKVIPNYPPYDDMPDSICMQKLLIQT